MKNNLKTSQKKELFDIFLIDYITDNKIQRESCKKI